jgi:AcrR family transcriptional regulator
MPTPAPEPEPMPPTVPTPPPRRRGPRPRYGREDVARAAVAIADAEGLEAVTFRAIAARLGTGVMSLYNYIPDKQALVFDMAELIAAELALPAPTGDWRADMHVVAGRQRDLALRHPWMIEAVSHLQPLGPATLGFLEFAQRQAAQYATLPDLLATGRYPRFAAAMAEGGQPETWDPAAHFDRLLDRVLDGLVSAASE